MRELRALQAELASLQEEQRACEARLHALSATQVEASNSKFYSWRGAKATNCSQIIHQSEANAARKATRETFERLCELTSWFPVRLTPEAATLELHGHTLELTWRPGTTSATAVLAVNAAAPGAEMLQELPCQACMDNVPAALRKLAGQIESITQFARQLRALQATFGATWDPQSGQLRVPFVSTRKRLMFTLVCAVSPDDVAANNSPVCSIENRIGVFKQMPATVPDGPLRLLHLARAIRSALLRDA
jgi:hypothetical protein